MYLTPQEQQQINELVAEVEAKTGTRIVTAIVAKADTYPEIPWKAFAVGAAIASLGVILAQWLRPDWTDEHFVTFSVLAILGTGATCGLLTVFVMPFARLFLDRIRADTEARQYAATMFFERRLASMPDRMGILILVSLFEHEVVILPDSGVSSHASAAELGRVITEMTPLLACGRIVDALITGLGALQALLLAKGRAGSETPSGSVEEKAK
ncbi:MAG: hypothetical protein KIT18_10150 [Burkholderiales bacterium]|nr:hypothetical protein [Burkholderiales bacterium]